jgi:hypothetical protein
MLLGVELRVDTPCHSTEVVGVTAQPVPACVVNLYTVALVTNGAFRKVTK